jgi:aldehyde:ferredoxin oxidoreductase
LGAVMGSKRLKAILLRRADKRTPGSPNKDTKSSTTTFSRLVANNSRVKVLRDYGTASTTMQVQVMGGLCARNFSQGSLENPDSVTGEMMRDLILERGGVGKPTESCMDGCVIQCSNIFPSKDGQLAAAPVEFETIGLCGINLGLNDFDQIARINRLCNDLGLDTIEIGAALGVMMEAAKSNSLPPEFANVNLPRFGDGERAAQVVEEIRTDGRLGQLIGSGVVATGRALGVKRIPAVKGQAMSAYDPRVIKGTGVTYATSPQGADHTAGLTLFALGDHSDPQKAIKDSRASQIQRAAYDALGLCVFNLGASGAQPQVVLDMLRTHYGVNVPANWLDEVGRRVIALELAFNRAAGLTSADDRLPAFFTQEPIAPTNNVFDVASEDMDNIWTGVLDV